MIKRKDILITGGAGFIGSHLFDTLIEGGNYVIIVDNFNDYYSGKDANLQSVIEKHKAEDYLIVRGGCKARNEQ